MSVVFPVEVPPVTNADKPPMHPSDAVLDCHCVGTELLKLLTCFDMSVRYYVTEFIFQLCGQDDGDFIALVGFGNAAGMLSMRPLFGREHGLTREGPLPSADALAAAGVPPGTEPLALQQRLLHELEKRLRDGSLKLAQLKQ